MSPIAGGSATTLRCTQTRRVSASMSHLSEKNGCMVYTQRGVDPGASSSRGLLTAYLLGALVLAGFINRV